MVSAGPSRVAEMTICRESRPGGMRSTRPSGERWQTEGVNRGIALGLAVALVTSGCSDGSDSAELQALQEEQAALKAQATTVAPTTTVEAVEVNGYTIEPGATIG